MQSENTQKHLYSNLCTYMDPNMPTAKFLPNSYIILFKNQPLVFFQQHFELRIWFDQYNAPQPQFQVQCLVKVVVIKQKQNMRNHGYRGHCLLPSMSLIN